MRRFKNAAPKRKRDIREHQDTFPRVVQPHQVQRDGQKCEVLYVPHLLPTVMTDPKMKHLYAIHYPTTVSKRRVKFAYITKHAVNLLMKAGRMKVSDFETFLDENQKVIVSYIQLGLNKTFKSSQVRVVDGNPRDFLKESGYKPEGFKFTFNSNFKD